MTASATFIVGVVELVDSLATNASWVRVCGRVRTTELKPKMAPSWPMNSLMFDHAQAVAGVDRHAVEAVELEPLRLGFRPQQGALDQLRPPRLEVVERADHRPGGRRHGRVDVVDDPRRAGRVVERLRRIGRSGRYPLGCGVGMAASVGYSVAVRPSGWITDDVIAPRPARPVTAWATMPSRA